MKPPPSRSEAKQEFDSDIGAAVASLGFPEAVTVADVKAHVLLPTWDSVNVSYDLLLDQKRLRLRHKEMEAMKLGLSDVDIGEPPLTFGRPPAPLPAAGGPASPGAGGGGGGGAGLGALRSGIGAGGGVVRAGSPAALAQGATGTPHRQRRRRWRRWYLGIQSKKEPDHVMSEVFRALMEGNFVRLRMWQRHAPIGCCQLCFTRVLISTLALVLCVCVCVCARGRCDLGCGWPSNGKKSHLTDCGVDGKMSVGKSRLDFSCTWCEPLPFSRLVFVYLTLRQRGSPPSAHLPQVQQDIYLLDLQKLKGDAFSFMNLCSQIILELKMPSSKQQGLTITKLGPGSLSAPGSSTLAPLRATSSAPIPVSGRAPPLPGK